MDSLEDNWWPTSITSSRPFSLPPSSKWLFKQEGNSITFIAGGNHAVYHMHQDCLPFLMLLDMVQQMYLVMANSADPSLSETFYKGVMFLNSLRQDVMAEHQHTEEDSAPLKKSLPESMHRWLCRLLFSIPHDPENRKQHAIVLQKAYEEINIFQYGMPFCLSPPICYLLTIQIHFYLQTSYIGH
jgi:hypothetical protein